MNFKEAYEEMLKGKKVRRPGWTSYWFIKDNKVFVKNIGCSSLKKKFSQVDIGYTATDDWEVVEEKEVWKPKKGERYCFYDSEGAIYEIKYDGDSIDKNRLDLGNCFKTRQEAEHMVEKLKIIKELRDFALENNEKEIDWKNPNQVKHIIVYNNETQIMRTDLWYASTQYIPFNIYFTSKEIAQRAIETIGEDRIKKYYFDV